jgi:IclR family KDG regulon transcriptional repressor
MNSNIGSYRAAYCTSLGKVLLSFCSEQTLQNYLQTIDFKPFTPKTIIDKTKFLEELSTIKKQGFAIDNEEFEVGLICVAVPVFNQNNELIASLSASGPANRFKKEELNNYVRILKNGAVAIQEKIANFYF